MVDMAPVMPLKTPVTLAAIKADPRFHDLALVRAVAALGRPGLGGALEADLRPAVGGVKP